MKMMFLGLAAMAFAAPAAAQPAAKISLTRLDCGHATIKDFNAFFSDTLEYKSGPRVITDRDRPVRAAGEGVEGQGHHSA